MLERALQKIAKNRCFLAIGFFFSHFALSANIDLVIQDQHGQALPDAVVELNKNNIKSAFTPKTVATMDQVNKQFSPELLIVQKGQQVNFPNSDNIRHHVYSFSQAKPFQLKLYSGQPKDPIVFDKPGVVVLGCNIHDSMIDYIYVADNDRVYKTDERGRVTLPATSSEVTVWHPLQSAALENKKIITINSQTQLLITINTSVPELRNTFGSKFKAQND
ncbi:methylamine utilization protein [Pseudoalteromonas fuliginea]|uniref:Methylamine utilization protein n=1 Tax=Pseudoalteromonas fuliginea TaxID=1872678 RepID=A0AB73BFY0_9GAMM|nr:methylamine utilization protein [Pseudoalteromonas fuliginea]KAA1159693.1 methylamine utilization protein [Pseudoalteromonas fuliginea]